MFSVESFAAVMAAFAERNVVFADLPEAPGTGETTWATGTGPSGFPMLYRIDHVGGGFHVYAERRRPQNPVAPLPYVSQDVIFDAPDPDISPVGTLTYPLSGRSFPAVVLVAGSGPHDRDGGMSLHKTLLVLADHLTRQGFAVLRYDKRGVGLTGGERHPGSTTDDYAADALAAVRFLAKQPNIDAGRIGVVGHSEGGIVAAMVAAEAPEEVAFIIMLAGTGLPGIEIKSLQDAAARRADGMPEPLVRLNQTQERGLLEIAASDLGHQEALAAMATATRDLPEDVKATLEIPEEGIPVDAYEELLTPWFRRFLELDPRTYLEKVTSPALALGGELDLQVPASRNLEEISQALTRAANPRMTVRLLPGVNHNLQTARTGKESEYFLIEETISPSVLAVVSAWLEDVAQDRR
ncbi:alpha/beta hydrolase family protein [Brevundimonas sp.]|uniref:alpha/beta hydrolase family protein n=1 Tax=Brevundimonas sp. TaxID=1871086 RepID=UPI003D6CA801